MQEKRTIAARKMAWYGLFLILAAMALVSVGLWLNQQGGDRVHTFYNVLSQSGADPWVYQHTDGYYYYTRTTGNNVTLKRSRTLTGIESGETQIIWKPEGEMAGFGAVWAPEIHFIKGKWYTYFATESAERDHRMYVIENEAADPFTGEWIFKGQVKDPHDDWAIDGTVLEVEDELYFVWSGWEDDQGGKQLLYIALMANPWTISSKRVEISRPEYDWETNHRPLINEGPQFIIKNETIHLVYSASGSWTDDYCLGLITADVSADLLDPASWTKRDQPIFQSANGLYGPGHHSFTKSPDGKEDWLIYHTAKWSGAGWTRLVRTQPFTWHDDNTPNLGEPADPNVPIALPSGEAGRLRYEAEAAMLSDGLAAAADETASGGYKAARVDGGEQSLTFEVVVSEAGEYNLFSRLKNVGESKERFVLQYVLNEDKTRLVTVDFSGDDHWAVVGTDVALEAGENTIKLKMTARTRVELDVIDLVKK